MGSLLSRAEFATVLANQKVNFGDEIVLVCEAKTEDLTATWQKNGQKLDCVHDKHIVEKRGNLFSLRIKKADEQDEGMYTITLKDKQKDASCSAQVTVELKEWRKVEWNQDIMIRELRDFNIRREEVEQLNFLLYGPVGAGKSSVINTIKTIFERRLYVNCLAAEGSTSQTLYYKKCEVGNSKDGFLPFTFNDIMGVEEGDQSGVHTDDIISALKGHVKEGYPFNPNSPLTEHNHYYLKNPTMSDRIHCLVCVIQADRIFMMDEDTIQKMQRVREEAKRMALPHVILMTHVDTTCEMTKKDLRSVYKSKRINKKIEECRVALGVQKSCIFPVKNYYEEKDINEDINCLMLDALTKIVHWADDYVVEYSR
ncbi:interferon-induced protein 44-like isoform X3 [Astyanax mexicanus]|uniref:Interferon-induced protein 44-like isoform X3 n=1 Tax=Astyanax mexicanus TaxID=7994 RepID=A0A8T2M1G0_ASTMX|nr:interferon-induced protein 44-like isoform X3 [Astyanax mexicanus]